MLIRKLDTYTADKTSDPIQGLKTTDTVQVFVYVKTATAGNTVTVSVEGKVPSVTDPDVVGGEVWYNILTSTALTTVENEEEELVPATTVLTVGVGTSDQANLSKKVVLPSTIRVKIVHSDDEDIEYAVITT